MHSAAGEKRRRLVGSEARSMSGDDAAYASLLSPRYQAPLPASGELVMSCATASGTHADDCTGRRHPQHRPHSTHTSTDGRPNGMQSAEDGSARRSYTPGVAGASCASWTTSSLRVGRETRKPELTAARGWPSEPLGLLCLHIRTRAAVEIAELRDRLEPAESAQNLFQLHPPVLQP